MKKFLLLRITENILAMSRPNTEMIKAKKIIEQFKKQVQIIFNENITEVTGTYCFV